MQTWGYLMFKTLLRHFSIAILFIIHLYKGWCYNIMLLQEELLGYWDRCHWKQWIIWLLHVWIPSLSVLRFTWKTFVDSSSFTFNSPLEEQQYKASTTKPGKKLVNWTLERYGSVESRNKQSSWLWQGSSLTLISHLSSSQMAIIRFF